MVFLHRVIFLSLSSATRGDSVSGEAPKPASPQRAALLCDGFLSRGHHDQMVPEWAGGESGGRVHWPYWEWRLDLSENGDAGNDS